MFTSIEELLACYEFLGQESTMIDPFTKLSYSELAGSFVDKFGVQWGGYDRITKQHIKQYEALAAHSR